MATPRCFKNPCKRSWRLTKDAVLAGAAGAIAEQGPKVVVAAQDATVGFAASNSGIFLFQESGVGVVGHFGLEMMK